MTKRCNASRGRVLRRMPINSSNSFPVSAVECNASASIAELWVTAAAMNFETAMAWSEAKPTSTTFFELRGGTCFGRGT